MDKRTLPNAPKGGVKYKFVKKFGLWCRTWFAFETNEDGTVTYKQHHAWNKDRKADWNKWGKK